MRSLSSTLQSAQQAKSLDPLVKIVLTHNSTTYTYTKTRIKDINHPEEPYSQTCELVLDNSDGTLKDIDLQGFKGVISYGVVTKAGEEYSACAPLWVIDQKFDDYPGNAKCTLSLKGIPNLMAEDEASESYMPDEDDTKTVKTLLTQIIGATLSCFSHCQAYEIVWDSEDSLIDTYKPKDSFRIYTGGTRLAAVRRLIEYTKCVMRVEADGKVHIFEPTISGETYDYQYSLDSGHVFFSKAYRKCLVIPNYIVVKSQTDDDPQYSGHASDAESYALIPKRAYKQLRLESNAQATAIAEAMLAQHKLWSELGAAEVPMNVGAEIFDYVKVAAFNAQDVFRVGNMGHLCRHWNAERKEWRMTFSFGNWMSVRKALADIGITSPDDISGYFTRLYAKDAYIENLTIDQISAYWLDPDGNIKAEELTDFLDHIPQGEYNALVKTMHLDASGLYFDSATIYTVRLSGEQVAKLWKSDTAQTSPGEGDFWIDTNFTPNKVKRWSGSEWQELPAEDLADLEKGIFIREVKSSSLTADGLVLLDELDDSGEYKRTKAAALTAEGLVLLDQVVEGTHGLVLKNDISSGHVKGSAIVQSSGYRLVDDGQIDDWDDGAALALTAYDLGLDLEDDILYGYLTLSSYTTINGTWYKEGGIKINASSGIVIYGNEKALVTRASEYGTDQCYVGSDGSIKAGAGAVRLDEDGVTIKGEFLLFESSGGSNRGSLFGTTSGLSMQSVYGYIDISASGVLSLGAGSGLDMVACGYLDMPERSSAPTGSNGRRYHNTTDHKNYQYVEGAWDIDG